MVTANDELNLWYEDQLVGYLWRNDLDRIGFRYEQDWLSSDSSFPISLQLPLTEHEFLPDEGKAHRFFANLLPEGQARTNIVGNLKISNSDFNLLREIGGECAGALSLLPFTEEPRTQHEYEKLSEEKLHNLISNRGTIYSLRENESIRLSLAGAQDKCPVLLKNGEFLLPKNGAPSTHILKFRISDLKHVPAYETVLINLAKNIGLPTVDVELSTLKGEVKDNPDETFIIIKRYDRYEDNGGTIHRLHQEDFCQALGLGYENKYQEKGGPSFSDCLDIVKEHSDDPAVDTNDLLRWQIFNLLAGNSDGHAKNLSLLYKSSYSRRIAPFYDLVCTRAIERIDTKLAFDIGGRAVPGDINQDAWIDFAKECDLGKKYVLQNVREQAEQILESLPVTLESFKNDYGEYPALQRVEQVVKSQCHRTLKDY